MGERKNTSLSEIKGKRELVGADMEFSFLNHRRWKELRFHTWWPLPLNGRSKVKGLRASHMAVTTKNELESSSHLNHLCHPTFV